MFILSTKQINTKENVFFSDSADRQKVRAFTENLFTANKNYFFKYQQFITKEIDEEKNFVFHTKIGIFKTLNQAIDYFNQLTESQEPIRLEAREWNQHNKILSKVEVLNIITGLPVRQLTNCLTNTCERFAGKCDETNGCSTVPFAKEYANSRKPFPIKVVVG